MKKAFKGMALVLGIGLIISLSGAAFGIYWVSKSVSVPLNPQAERVMFRIDPGTGLNAVADQLQAKGLIAHALGLKLYARYQKTACRIKAGEYLISAAMPPAVILQIFIEGKERLLRVTIPEGFNMDQIAQRVAARGWCSKETFLTLCRDMDFIHTLNVPSHTLEGFLFPETYFFPPHADCRQIIQKMVDTFYTVFTPAWQEQTRLMGFSLQEIVTLASMIEKETGDPGERPMISSVFHNRLKKRMRLESDPTVVYGDTEFTGRIRTRHLKRFTPYNTYQIPGLPKGPIASPGTKSLEAALYPEKSNFLFFVSKNDGTHQFSRTLAQHNKAVRTYQLNR